MEDLILESRLSSIVAPAGCGKTQLIVNILRRNQPKPYLVLTHTTAGVSALKNGLLASTSLQKITLWQRLMVG